MASGSSVARTWIPATPSPSPSRPLCPQRADDEEIEMRGGEFSFHLGDDVADAGVFLTWKDLSVSVAARRSVGAVSILRDVTGYANPGEVLAIMGPSGCGKSTLLDTLAGRLGSGLTQNGDILINGQKQKLAFGTSAYVTQDDVLMTTLTVREAVCYSAQLQLPDSMSTSAKRARAEATMREMGLTAAMDTRIGGWHVKGISGGQRRRVSICVELLTRPPLLFLDEPTSGLDSAAAYHVVHRLARLARHERMTVVAAVHQPGSEVFDLFDRLCLLAYGSTVFFGPAPAAAEFFASNGFACPSLRNPSDHFLRTINKDFDTEGEELEANSKSASEAIEILVKAYGSSLNSQQVIEQIAKLKDQRGALVKKRSHASFTTQSLVLTRRSFVNMYRDLGYYWLRLAVYVALSLCLGTIFYDIGHSFGSIQARVSMLMYITSFLTFMAIGGFPSFVEDMKIFGRERLNGHYGAAAFTIANTLSAAPYLALIAVLPGALAYYLVRLRSPPEHFLYFVLVLFMCMMLVEGLMMIVASVVPNFLMGIITGAGIQGVMMLNGGFFQLPHDLPKPVWRYPMYYISFHKYAFQGFYKNEFLGMVFPSAAGGNGTVTGEEVLRDVWQVELGYSKWVNLGILFGMAVLYRLMFLGIVKVAEKVKPKIKSLMANAS
ncbi:ABC transporter G family member 1-like [Curcuma longa]|uniref:ABC transporter G family member 1-like n=1 Tax=Curcuma longa TaxID=136217 RepID=UPI003D9DDDA3